METHKVIFDETVEAPAYIIWLKNGLCIDINFNKHNVKISKKVT